MRNTKIEWCDSTCNPVCGCTFGCEFCYARRMNNRFHYVKDFTKPQFFPDRLKQLYTKKPKNIFMDSMSDIADWEDKWVADTIDAMEENPQHNYLFLSKRPQLIYEYWPQLCKSNIWCGATGTEHQSTNEAIYCLDGIRGRNTFLSLEPLLNEVQFAKGIENINWIILGSETGHRKNKVIPKIEWIMRIVSECEKHKIPVFMKDSLRPIVKEVNILRQLPDGLKK